MFRHKIRQPAPAAADIQHAHTRLELQLLANQTQLGLLGLFKRRRLFPVGAGVLHERVQHTAEQVVAKIVVLFAYDPCAFFTLQIEQSGRGDAQGVFQIARELIFKTGTQHAGEKGIQTFALPPAVHVAFSQA